MPSKQTILTKENATEVLKLMGKSMDAASSFFDVFRKEQSIRIEWTSPDYFKAKFVWGLIEIEKGEHRIFELKGKPAFVKEVRRVLESRGPVKVLNTNDAS